MTLGRKEVPHPALVQGSNCVFLLNPGRFFFILDDFLTFLKFNWHTVSSTYLMGTFSLRWSNKWQGAVFAVLPQHTGIVLTAAPQYPPSRGHTETSWAAFISVNSTNSLLACLFSLSSHYPGKPWLGPVSLWDYMCVCVFLLDFQWSLATGI